MGSRPARHAGKEAVPEESKRVWSCDKQGQPQGGCNEPALRGLRIAPACHIGKRQVLRWVRQGGRPEARHFWGKEARRRPKYHRARAARRPPTTLNQRPSGRPRVPHGGGN